MNAAMSESRHGTHLVRADVHSPSGQGRGRRGGPLPGGRRADRPRDHRRDRHLLPSRRQAAAEGEGHVDRATARRCSRAHWSDAFVLDGPGEYEVKEVLLTGVRTYRDDAKGAERGQAGRLPRRARRTAHDPPRGDRPPPDRGEARRHRAGRHRLRPDRRLAVGDEGRRARRPARPADRHRDAARRG